MNNLAVAKIESIPFSCVLDDYAELLKLRVNSLVVLTAWCGAYLATGHFSLPGLLHVVCGVGSVAAGAAALNEVLERHSDGRMLRTARRPLVTGRLSVAFASFFGIALVTTGILYLAFTANMLTASLALLTCLAYVFAYTPWKKIGPACTAIGAIPGAMPIVLGWTSARGALDSRALLLFSILYFWQFPHFHAIALLYREDYERAGIRMLAVVDPGGHRIATQILFPSLALVGASVIPYALHISGIVYLILACVFGIWMCSRAIQVCLPLYSSRIARPSLYRALMRATIIYLPVVLSALVANRIG